MRLTAPLVLHKHILQMRMCSHPVELDVWFLVEPFAYFHTSCVRTAKALARLSGCAGSPEPSLVAYVISTIISWAGSIKDTLPFWRDLTGVVIPSKLWRIVHPAVSSWKKNFTGKYWDIWNYCWNYPKIWTRCNALKRCRRNGKQWRPRSDCSVCIVCSYVSVPKLRIFTVMHSPCKTMSKIALQALQDTPPLCLFLLLSIFWHKKKYQCK